MNIVVLANGFPDEKRPQRGCFEKDQAIALGKIGHKVSVLYAEKIGIRSILSGGKRLGVEKRKSCGIYVCGIVCCYLGFHWLSYKLNYLIKARILNIGLKHIIKANGKPDVIYAHFMYNIAYAVYLKKKYGIPVVGMEHWSVLNKENLSCEEKFLGNVAYNNVELLISCADSLRQLIIKKFGKDSLVVHNMVGEEFLNAYRSHKQIGQSATFVSIGSLIHRKGFDVLINSFAMALERNPNLSLKIVGDGEEKENLQHQIEDLNVADRVTLLGSKTKTEIANILSASDYFVLASRAENFSVAVLEGLSAGLPVIATLCGGIKECIDDSNGIIVPVDDVRKLSDALLEIVSNEEKYNRESISLRSLEKYAPQNVGLKVSSLLEGVCNGVNTGIVV